jgi:hypothetical protein
LRKVIFLLAVELFLLTSLSLAATSTHKKSSARKKSSTATAARQRTGKTAVASKTTSRKGRSSRTAKRTAQRRPPRQSQPTPERYREIQSALASKGYLQGEPTGQWDQSSLEALRRFQQDQNLEPSGKLDSLSLIALGLGPKHESSASSVISNGQNNQ